MKRNRGIYTAVCVLATGAVLVGCGDDDTDATAGTSADGAADVAAAVDRVETLRKPSEALEIPRLASRPEPGREAYWISCKFPECEAADPGLEAAMAALGWKLTTLKPDVTPEDVAGAWAQAVAAEPDAIIGVHPLPVEVIGDQLEQAETDGIAVAMMGAPAEAGPFGIDASIASSPWIEANGVALTDWAVADSEGDAQIVYLYDESFPLHVAAFEAGSAEAAATCPDCEVDGLPVKLADAGKGVPGQVISYIQKNPDTDYVLAVGASSLALGVGQAIRSADLPVKVATVLSSPQNLVAVQDGTEAAALPNELSSLAWRVADAAVREVEGDELPDDLANPVGERQLIDETNIDSVDVSVPWDVPDVEATFRRAWRLR